MIAGEAGPLELVAAGSQDIAQVAVAGSEGVTFEIAERELEARFRVGGLGETARYAPRSAAIGA